MARLTSTPTCTRGWRRRRAKRASRKLPIGSKLSPRPRNPTQDASPRRRARSNRVSRTSPAGGAPAAGPPPALGTARPPPGGGRGAPGAPASKSPQPGFFPMANRIEARPSDGLSYNSTETKYWDRAGLDKEVERVFDICHPCRLCFNLCPSFPALFDATDRNDGDVRGLTAAEKARVIELCYGCKLCEIKCPYTPRDGHEFQLDFPRLILRAKAVNAKEDGVKLRERLLAHPDQLGKAGATAPALANWGCHRKFQRVMMEKIHGIHRGKLLPDFAAETFDKWLKSNPLH